MGPERFEAFVEGGAAMDRHFRTAPLADNMPVEAYATLPDAIRTLEEHLLPRWRAIHKLLIIDDILTFGEQVGEVAETFSLPGLTAYGEQLCDHARQYDIVALETLLKAFPDLLEELKHCPSVKNDTNNEAV